MFALLLAIIALWSMPSRSQELKDLRCDVYQFVGEQTNLKGVININRHTRETSEGVAFPVGERSILAACLITDENQLACGFWDGADTPESGPISEASFPYDSPGHHLYLRMDNTNLMILCYQSEGGIGMPGTNQLPPLGKSLLVPR